MTVYNFYIKELKTINERLKNKNKDQQKKAVFIYIHRLNMMNEFIYYAGIKSTNDLYSTNFGSDDWNLLNVYTEE